MAEDHLAAECLIQIIVNDALVTTLLGSPEDVEELVVGHLMTEHAVDVQSITDILVNNEGGSVQASTSLRDGQTLNPRFSIVTSSCGACDQTNLPDLIAGTPTVDPSSFTSQQSSPHGRHQHLSCLEHKRKFFNTVRQYLQATTLGCSRGHWMAQRCGQGDRTACVEPSWTATSPVVVGKVRLGHRGKSSQSGHPYRCLVWCSVKSRRTNSQVVQHHAHLVRERQQSGRYWACGRALQA